MINSIETCLKEISLQNSQWRVCFCLFFCFGRQDGTFGPSPLMTFGQRPRSVQGRQFSCRKKLNERNSNHASEKRTFLFWSTTNKQDHDAHNDVLDVLCSDLNPSDANCQGQRALWFLKTIVGLTTILALVALVALVPFKSVLLQVLKRPLKNAKDTHCGRGHKGTLRNLNCRETASGTWISSWWAWKGTKLSNARKRTSF